MMSVRMHRNDHTVVYIPDKRFIWHNEDAWLSSEQFPIYAVADGVTMEGLEEVIFPTGAKMVADLFCRKTVEFLETKYKEASLDTLREAYSYANDAIKNLNATQPDIAAAVGSAVIVERDTILGSRITDCGFALLRRGALFFKTPD